MIPIPKELSQHKIPYQINICRKLIVKVTIADLPLLLGHSLTSKSSSVLYPESQALPGTNSEKAFLIYFSSSFVHELQFQLVTTTHLV